MKYLHNIVEFVECIYKDLKIDNPHKMSIELITDHFDIGLHYWSHSSEIVGFYERYEMFIDEKITWREQWQDFGHEMSHYFLDDTCSTALNDLYVDYRESKAEYFSYHFCVPTFMLNQLDDITIYNIMNLFNVEFEFALRRLEMYKNRMLTKGAL